jgi:hypothetical protein
MELKYVGAKPSVSAKGVTFDQTKPDRYTFLNAAVELLEALSFEATGDKKLYLYNVSGKELSGAELVEMLKKHCANPQEAFDSVRKLKRMTGSLRMSEEHGLATLRSCVTIICNILQMRLRINVH